MKLIRGANLTRKTFMSKKKWSNKEILKSISNPNGAAYETKIKIPELTFEGVRSQPDFATLYITNDSFPFGSQFSF